MSRKILVAYFSATGTTAKIAKKLAAAAGADLYEIEPEVPYTGADLDWTDKSSRSTIEMNDPASRPTIVKNLPDMGKYDIILLGFPIWWYEAPMIIHSFLESCDFSGKIIVPFATSGSSGMGKTNEKLKASCPGAVLLPGRMMNDNPSEADLRAWVERI
ncbi:MAG: flavodoxin [Clostridiales bacterium]|nr:flavodoxin [Clostridiales bacterium]